MTGPTFWWVYSGVVGFGSMAWVVSFAGLLLSGRTTRRLRDLPSDKPPEGWPGLAVIFAARDEAEGVAKATRSLLAQDYPGLRLIAVDDRSADGTGPILDALAAEDPRLSVVHVRELPDGWLGKCHALQLGAEAAEGAEWLLFTDADVVFAPGTLRRAVGHASGASLDHLTVSPDVPTETFLERVFLAMFTLAFALYAPPRRVSDAKRKAAVGVGAFNLVRAETFHAIGGFRNIRLSVDDDMRLGQALKFAGYRNDYLSGQGDVTVYWHVGAWGMIVGLEKNFFAGLNYRLWLVPVSAAAVLAAGFVPFVAVVVGPWWDRLVACAGIASACTILGRSGGLSRLAWYHALFLPLGSLMFVVALLRSTYLTLLRGGVCWRGHLYPLGALREHVRRRDSWLNEIWLSTR